jgi:hypothetical protein
MLILHFYNCNSLITYVLYNIENIFRLVMQTKYNSILYNILFYYEKGIIDWN